MRWALLACFLWQFAWASHGMQGDTIRACADPKYRQFDFWIGEWNVYAKEKLVGTNRIEQILGGCALMENWEGAGGSVGHSFNIYNAQTGKWEQTWIDNSGLLVHFQGEFANGKMLFTSGTSPGDPKFAQSRMSFTPQPDGTIRQLWEGSADGKTWRVIFDGVYKRP